MRDDILNHRLVHLVGRSPRCYGDSTQSVVHDDYYRFDVSEEVYSKLSDSYALFSCVYQKEYDHCWHDYVAQAELGLKRFGPSLMAHYKQIHLGQTVASFEIPELVEKVFILFARFHNPCRCTDIARFNKMKLQ